MNSPEIQRHWALEGDSGNPAGVGGVAVKQVAVSGKPNFRDMGHT